MPGDPYYVRLSTLRDAADAEPAAQLHVRAPRQQWRQTIVPLTVTALVALAFHVVVTHEHINSVLISDTLTGAATDAPPVHHTSNKVRQLPAVVGGATGFVRQNPTLAARFDPCRPISYVISGPEPYAGASAALESAIEEVSHDTGLQFVDQGATTEPASVPRSAYQPQLYGENWAPVLVAWTDATTIPGLAGPVVGMGGGEAATVDGQARLVSGIVYLDAPDLASIAAVSPAGARAVMLHELGHLVGLGHVTDPSSVMYPDGGNGIVDYSAGDLNGLAWAGQGPCYSTY